MKLALASLASVVLALAGPAHAETALGEYDALGRRPSRQLVETQCDLDVQIKGGVVTVEQRQRLANPSAGPGPYDLGAVYELELPAGATITGFAHRGDGAVEQALPITGEYATVAAGIRPMFGADPALLVARGGSQYAIYVQPFAADHEVTITTRYTALVDVVAGALRFVLPGRSEDGKLTACRGTLRATPGPGATISNILVNGASTTARPAPFVVDTKPVVLEAQLAFAGREPIVWTQSEPLSAGYTASVITIAAPAIRTTTPLHRRALLVIDSSRSMELVGRHNVAKVVRSVAAALPANIEVDAIFYDRTATRVFDAWKPSTTASTAAIEKTLALRPAVNGSNLAGALRLARTTLDDGRATSTLVVVISDGVLGDVQGQELTRALDGKTSTVDVLAVVLDPARTRSPGATALRAPVSLYGGTFVEVAADELDEAIVLVDEWLRPSWLELTLGDLDIPHTVRSGGGFVRTVLDKHSPSKLVLVGHGDTPIKIAPRTGPAAPVAALVLAATDDAENRDDTDSDPLAQVRAKAVQRSPYVSAATSFAVLSTAGKLAKNRSAMIKGGAPYERLVALRDPDDAVANVKAGTPAAPSAIAKITLERLFRDQLQPKAYACYQRALGTAPTLAGTVHFTLHLGRGEITQVQLAGLGNAQLDACLLEAAYLLSVPMPDFAVNADDQTIARYPLTFSVGKDHPVIVLGDADSTSPLDIDAIEGGVPARGKPIKVDARTPLGTMRPSK